VSLTELPLHVQFHFATGKNRRETDGKYTKEKEEEEGKSEKRK